MEETPAEGARGQVSSRLALILALVSAGSFVAGIVVMAWPWSDSAMVVFFPLTGLAALAAIVSGTRALVVAAKSDAKTRSLGRAGLITGIIMLIPFAGVCWFFWVAFSLV